MSDNSKADSLEAAREWLDGHREVAYMAHHLASFLDSREASLREEIERLKDEYARVTGISEDEAWVLDVPADDKACVAEYRIRWLRVKIMLERAEQRLKKVVSAAQEVVKNYYQPIPFPGEGGTGIAGMPALRAALKEAEYQDKK